MTDAADAAETRQAVHRCTVETIRHRARGSAFTIARVRLDTGKSIGLLGPLGDVIPGDVLLVAGEIERDERFGDQIRCTAARLDKLPSAEALALTIRNLKLPGIGPRRSDLLVAAFGPRVLELAETNPSELVAAIPSLKADQRPKVLTKLKNVAVKLHTIALLVEAGLTVIQATKALAVMGAAAPRIAVSNPWRLAGVVPGMGFATCDQAARRSNADMTSDDRMHGAIVHSLNIRLEDDGHLYMPESTVATDVATMLADHAKAFTYERIKGGVNYLAEQKRILIEDEHKQRHRAVYLVAPHFDEHQAAELVAERLAVNPRNRQISLVAHSYLEEKQAEAVRNAFTHHFSILTGGPGVGKTRTIDAIIAVARQFDERVVLMAPTGQAAMRMREVTKHPASTIHRALGIAVKGGQQRKVMREVEQAALVVIDESSMIDQTLFRMILERVPKAARILMVGDADQLPPVGPGSPFKELVASKAVPTVRLQKVFRQIGRDDIVTAAADINRGVMPGLTIPGYDGNFIFIEELDAEGAAQRIAAIAAERCTDAFDVDPWTDVLVMTPMHKGPLGTLRLNELIQARLNPQGERFQAAGHNWRVGDRIRWRVNEYGDMPRVNGDMGRIVGLVRNDKRELTHVEISFDFESPGTRCRYPLETLKKVQMAYAITVHSSQGSEAPLVVVAVHPAHAIMLERSLLYTAVTRARRHVVLVGARRAIYDSVQRISSRRRHTRMGDLITGRAKRERPMTHIEHVAKQMEDEIGNLFDYS